MSNRPKIKADTSSQSRRQSRRGRGYGRTRTHSHRGSSGLYNASKKVKRDNPPLTAYNPSMDWIPVTDRLPPFEKSMLVCSSLPATYHVAYDSPQGKKWHLSFGDMGVPHITHWMPLPELPKGSVVV